MPFNGSGTFVPLAPPTFPAVAGSPIVANYYNSQVLDIINQGLSLVLPRDGQAAMTGNLNMGNNRLVALAAPIVGTDASTKAYVDALIAAVTTSIGTTGLGYIPKRGGAGFENSILVENLGNLDCFGDIFLTDTSPTIFFNVGGPYIQGVAANTLGIFTSGTRQVTIDNLGNVGIGNTNPAYRLDIGPGVTGSIGYVARLRGNASDNTSAIQFTNNAVSDEQALIQANGGGLILQASGTKAISLRANGTERLNIASGGQVSVNFGSASGNTIRNMTISTSAPSGGADGDVWLRY